MFEEELAALEPDDRAALQRLVDRVPPAMQSTGTVRFTAAEPLDLAVLDRLLAVRRSEIEG